jgi:hypothetical protein
MSERQSCKVCVSVEDASFYNPAFVSLQGRLEQAETTLIAGIEGGLIYWRSILCEPGRCSVSGRAVSFYG